MAIAGKNGRWTFIQNLDMKNIPGNNDEQIADPKKQAIIDRSKVSVNKKN
jgi:hypothetical protein